MGNGRGRPEQRGKGNSNFRYPLDGFLFVLFSQRFDRPEFDRIVRAVVGTWEENEDEEEVVRGAENSCEKSHSWSNRTVIRSDANVVDGSTRLCRFKIKAN